MTSYFTGFVDGGDLVFLRRAEGGQVAVDRFRAEWSLFVRAEDAPETLRRQLAASSNVTAVREDAGGWLRIGLRDQDAREALAQPTFKGRDGVECEGYFAKHGVRVYEGDVHPVRQWMTDHPEVGVQAPRRAYYDLETDSRVPFRRKEDARILSWALVGADGRRVCGVLEGDDDASERRLLEAFWRACEPYDQLLAWSGSRFDEPVLRARNRVHAIAVDVRRWLFLDQLALYKRMNTMAESGEEKQSHKLNDIAQQLLGEGKHDFDASRTWEAWSAGGERRAEMVRYMMQDALLLPMIEAKTGFAATFDALAQACRVFPDDVGLNPTVQVDAMLLGLGRARGMRFKTRTRMEEGRSDKFAGAYVMEPKLTGYVDDVHVCDFARLYPSMIVSWNMSPETVTARRRALDGGEPRPSEPGVACAAYTGVEFAQAEQGILSFAVSEIIRLREHWKERKKNATVGTSEWVDADRRDTAYKVATNTIYGVIGSPFSRYFDRDVAESVTQCGKWMLEKTIVQIEARGWRAIAGDTDSAFVVGPTAVEFRAFVKWINADYYPTLLAQAGAARNVVELAYEKQFSLLAIVGKKRYFGRYAHFKGKPATVDSKPEVKGLEYKRSDTLALARRLQFDVVNHLLGGRSAGVGAVHDMLARAQRHVMHDALPLAEVQLSKSLSRPLGGYARPTKLDGEKAAEIAHVAVAYVMLERGLEVGEGTRIAYVVADASDGIKPIPASDYDGSNVDRCYLWEHLIFPPTRRVLDAVHPEHDWGGWSRVRVKEVPAKKTQAPKAQAALALVEAPPPTVERSTVGQRATLEVVAATGELGPVHYVVRTTEHRVRLGAFKELREIAARHPGPHVLRLEIASAKGRREALFEDVRVDGSLELGVELARVFG